MRRCLVSRAAEDDLDAIWEYIAADSIDAADRWIEKLRQGFEKLTASPGIGHSRRDLTSLPVLFWAHGNYLVVYRVAGPCIEIVAVTQGARDVPTFLSGRGE